MEVKYIDIVYKSQSKSGKTQIWYVLSYEDDELGEIRWMGRWRRYAFYPAPDTVFEKDCLRKIANFCDDNTIELRKTWKKRKSDAASPPSGD